MIELLDVTVHRSRRLVLDRIALTAAPGSITAVVGPNGSGKSTIVAAIGGDLPISGGSITVAGTPVADQAPETAARSRAVMTQSGAVALGFRVAEVVAMGRSPWRNRPEGAHDTGAVAAAMLDADVAHLADRPVQSLSGGEQARVTLARVLAQDTPVILLDEPTAALDLRHQLDTMRLLRDRATAGATVLVVLHDLTLAAATADHVVVLSSGRVAVAGPPSAALSPDVIADVYGVRVTVLTDPGTGLPVLVPAGLA